MSGIDCGKLEEVLESIFQIPVDAARLDKWVNGGEFETVVLGDKEVPTLRNLVRQIDERESQAAEEEINEAKAEIGALAAKIQAKIDELKAMTASAETLPPGSQATVYYNASTGEFEFGVPEGKQGVQGERGQAPAIDIIYGGDPSDEALSVIYGGNPALDEPGDRTIVRQVNRIGTSAQWTLANPVLEDGETGYERTTDGKLLWKTGDGVTHWNDLPYPSILVDRIYRFRGSVATVDDLPTDAAEGDVYNITSSGANFAWTGETWDNLGVVQEIDPAPIKDSGNPVASGGVYEALEAMQENITATGAPDNVTIIKNESGKLVAQNIAIGGDPTDLASARGQIGTAVPIGNIDLNTLIKTGYYLTDNGSTNKPAGFTQTAVLVYERKVSNATRRLYQIAFNSTSTRIKVRRAVFNTGLEDAPTLWDEWQDITLSSLFGDGIRVTNGIVSVPEYEGATDTAAGVAGLVNPATPEEKDFVYHGDGTWRENTNVKVDNKTISKDENDIISVITGGIIDDDTIVLDENGKLKSKSIPFENGSLNTVASNIASPAVTPIPNIMYAPDYTSGNYDLVGNDITLGDNYIQVNKSGFYFIMANPSFASVSENQAQVQVIVLHNGNPAFASTVDVSSSATNPDFTSLSDVLYLNAGDKLHIGYGVTVNTITLSSFGSRLFRIPVTNEYQVSNPSISIYSQSEKTISVPAGAEHTHFTVGDFVNINVPGTSVEKTQDGYLKILESGFYGLSMDTMFNILQTDPAKYDIFTGFDIIGQDGTFISSITGTTAHLSNAPTYYDACNLYTSRYFLEGTIIAPFIQYDLGLSTLTMHYNTITVFKYPSIANTADLSDLIARVARLEASKTISTAAPSGGTDGDVWFQYID